MNMLNTVVDTNVLVSSFKSSGRTPYTIVELIKNKKVALYYSDPILYEYWDVLFRKKFNFDPIAVTQLIHSIVKFGVLVEDIECKLKTSDETDQIFLNAAVEAASAYGLVYLVTGNIKHFPKKAFIVTPVQFMKIYLEN